LKRRDLVRHLEQHGCGLLREGANHTIYINRSARKTSTVPRHSEINNELAKKICKDPHADATVGPSSRSSPSRAMNPVFMSFVAFVSLALAVALVLVGGRTLTRHRRHATSGSAESLITRSDRSTRAA
jgi:mRNA interferase HicA